MTLNRPFFMVAAAAAISAFSFGPALAQDAAPAEAETAQTAAEAPEGKVLPDIVLGQDDAPVTMIEYASFTCSHCRDFHNNNFEKLKTEFIDTGKVKFIQRDVYFDAVGLWAGVLARCGGDEKYYAVSDLLFTEQTTWLAGKTGDEIAANLRKVGAKAGMAPDQMEACWNNQQTVADLVTTFQTNAGRDQIEGTPTFFVNGEKVHNQPWEELKKVLDAKVAAAG